MFETLNTPATWQLIRYAVVGGLITALGQAIYYFGVEWGGLDPNLSIAVAFVRPRSPPAEASPSVAQPGSSSIRCQR